MKSTVFIICLSALVVPRLFGQSNCDCYSIEGIKIHSPTDSSNIIPEIHQLVGNESDAIDFTLKNTCDNNVYIKLFMITNSNDTLAWTTTWSIFVLPMNTNVTWRIDTKLTALPPLGSYRIAITNGTLICDSIKINPLATGVNENIIETDNKIKFYPNPFSNTLRIVGSKNLQTVVLYNITGTIVAAKDNLQSELVEISTEHFSSGIYTVQITDNLGNITTKRIIK